MKRRLLTGIVLLVSLLVYGQPVSAHANLLRSTPGGNETLNAAPAEIILVFTEPLEPAYSRFTLLDGSGNEVNTPASFIDPTDQHRMLMQPGALPDGLYTVVWRVVSAADGHPTRGTFAFGVGVSVETAATTLTVDESVKPEAIIIRWLNFMSLAVGVGSLGFWLFVWQPTGINHPATTASLNRLILIGWLLMGLASIPILLLQTSILTDLPLLASFSAMVRVITTTNYGSLWILRTVYWLLAGGLLFTSSERSIWLERGGLVFEVLVLLTVSLFSHASGAADQVAAVAGDWLHLIGSTLWVGGLIAFGYTLYRLRRDPENVPSVSTMIALFSNYVRICVVALIISGLYSTWLQIGTLEALTGTAYGRALLIKLLLFLPLLAIAGVNLIFTTRGLQAGQALWAGRLRGLVNVEVVLTAAIMVAVSMMTSGVPGRNVQAIRDAEPPAVAPNRYLGMELVNNQMFHLEIAPGYVGENEFTVTVTDEAGKSIADASLIRLRFTNQDVNIGESELRPEAQADEPGAYRAAGANLSTPGNYRIRMTMQRPGQFDTVVDFETEIRTPPPPPAPVIDTAIPVSNRLMLALAVGLMLVVLGGFFMPGFRQMLSGAGVVSGAMLAIGLVFLITAGTNYIMVQKPGDLVVVDAYARPAGRGETGGVYLTIQNNTGSTERLIDATTEIAADVEIHQTVVENQIARMRPTEGIALPPGVTTRTEPEGGYHIMLINLHNKIGAGEVFKVDLKFDSGKELTVDVQVRDTLGN